ncbi:hypothetical protein V493_06685 [Pseudogymnoascus sp. VKM F-4281 (FW-2241)]|nr:hypothetical protein V493_06685 [Pseudogymnoascus sp. VKM F-4281 (FW-2241)]
MHYFASLPTLLATIVGLTSLASAAVQVHDETFVPDAVIHVSSAIRKQSCVDEKEVVLINGTSPGPEIRLQEGKTFWIRVYNDLKHENLTMHWHGLTMAAAPFSDGTPLASQWPFPPDSFYDYEISVPVGSAGTYFYHSHVGIQAIACTGPLSVIEAGDPPYEYFDEKWLFFQDVFKQNDSYILEGLSATPQRYDGDQAMVLINGKGGGVHDKGIVCNEPLSVINVEPGRTYRFRVVGASAISFETFGIEGHNDLELIEADGGYIEKYNTSFIQVAAGQRFSFLFHAKQNPEKQRYYVQLETRDHGNRCHSYAVINYGDQSLDAAGVPAKYYPPVDSVITLPEMDHEFLEYQLRPLENNYSDPVYSSDDFPTADEVTRRINVTIHLAYVAPNVVYELNGYPWFEHTPKEPYLVSIIKNDTIQFPSMERAAANEGLDPVSKAFPAEIGEVLEVVVRNTASDRGTLDNHPWHVHGEHVWHIGSGFGEYDSAANEAKWANSPGKPVRRDTMMIYRNTTGRTTPNYMDGWTAWRIRVKTPGVWMVHCHLLPHIVFGMQTVWVFGNYTDVTSKVGQPDYNGYLDFGGSVVGNETHWPEVVQSDTYDEWAVEDN